MILNGFQKIIFQNRYVALETPSRSPPFMAKTILNFHFDYLITSLISQYQPVKDITEVVPPSELHLDEDFEKLQNKEKAAAAFAAVSKKK